MKVYLFTTGEYEDKRIKNIFLRESDAQQYMNEYNASNDSRYERFSEIEEWEVIE